MWYVIVGVVVVELSSFDDEDPPDDADDPLSSDALLLDPLDPLSDDELDDDEEMLVPVSDVLDVPDEELPDVIAVLEPVVVPVDPVVVDVASGATVSCVVVWGAATRVIDTVISSLPSHVTTCETGTVNMVPSVRVGEVDTLMM